MAAGKILCISLATNQKSEKGWLKHCSVLGGLWQHGMQGSADVGNGTEDGASWWLRAGQGTHRAAFPLFSGSLGLALVNVRHFGRRVRIKGKMQRAR